jgi:hypothetical protein
MDITMPTFQVQRLPNGPRKSPVASYEKVEAQDELDAGEQVLKIPLQREPRHDIYIRAFARRLGVRRVPIKLYAKAETT